LLFALLFVGAGIVLAQDGPAIRGLHKVKRKETIFGISRMYEITIDELIEANPEMRMPDFELKKGMEIKIPFSKHSAQPQQANQSQQVTQSHQTEVTPQTAKKEDDDVRNRAIRLGVMLPLHDINGDGKRMVEYYRGVLMACDSLKANGISTDIRAWNVAEDTDIQKVLRDPNAANRDLIIGPLYSKQVKALGDFAQKHDIRLLIPFSISSTDVNENPNVFQVHQNGSMLNQSYVSRYYQRFSDSHTVIIDCNDSTSTKGAFTSALRRKLEQEGASYTITNLRSSEAAFKKSFSDSKRNVVVLNTSRSADLNVAFAKLNGLAMTTPSLRISVFGYQEWLQYTRQHLDNMYKFDTYVPSVYYLNPLSRRVEHFKKKYRWNFHQDLQNYPQPFAVTGFDQAFFMIKGLHMYGTHFIGASGMVGYTPMQKPLQFERVGNGRLQNKAILFVHYTPANRIDVINF
jgi:hypothetical protein